MSDRDRTLDELPVPPAVWDDPESGELLRAWVANGCLHVSLRHNWDDPAFWGIFLSDVARHAAKALASETLCSEHEALDMIKARLDEEWIAPTSPIATDKVQTQ